MQHTPLMPCRSQGISEDIVPGGRQCARWEMATPIVAADMLGRSSIGNRKMPSDLEVPHAQQYLEHELVIQNASQEREEKLQVMQ